MVECLNKKIIDLLTEGVIFDYAYLSRRMTSIDTCYTCEGYKPHCRDYIPDGVAERLKMFMDGVIDPEEP